MTKSSTVTFGAVGDIAFCGQTSEEMLTHGMDWPFQKMAEHLKRADLLFGNMETVAIPDNFPAEQLDPDGMISHIPGPDGAAALKRVGFDFLNLAANHVLDAGSIGMDHTKKCLDEAGIVTGGVGYTQEEARQMKVVEKNGIRFGFLCYGEDSNWTLGQTNPGYAYYELDTVLEDVTTHRDEVDVLVISIHADIEFMPTPSVPRLANSRTIARAGADIILQHHPHVPQGIEMVDGSLIAYSLGNFVFDAHTGDYMKRNGPHTADSFLLLMEVGTDGVHSFERIPARICESPEQRPHPLSGAEAEKMLAYFAELDRLLHDETFVRKTWREVARRHLEVIIKRAAKLDIDEIMEEVVGRACLVAENRSYMEEILAEARERWTARQKQSDPYHRPNFRFQKKQ